jgi:hypothetical protein
MDINENELETVFNYRVYTNEQKTVLELDWSMLLYNHLYSSYEFYENKFPPGFDNIVGFDKIIQQMADNNINNTPLNELEYKLYMCNNINE